MDLLDKVRGVFMGEALGDALGAPHEFKYHKSNVYTGLIHHKFKFLSRFQPVKWLVPGSTTDDTEMTLTLAKSLIRNNGYNEEDVIISYERWANDSLLLGKNTRALFKGVKTIKGYKNRYTKLFNNEESIQNSQSNGSMMRCSSLAFIFDNIPTILDCKLTNPSIINIDANLVYVSALRMAILGYNNITIFNTVKDISQTVEVRNVLIDVVNKKSRDIKNFKGWVLHSLYCSMWSLLYAFNYQEGIDYIINLGGDTDTTVAISGALLGGLFGYNKISSEERTKYNIEIMLTVNTNESDNPRSNEYTLGPTDNFIAFTNEFYLKIALSNLGNKMVNI